MNHFAELTNKQKLTSSLAIALGQFEDEVNTNGTPAVLYRDVEAAWRGKWRDRLCSLTSLASTKARAHEMISALPFKSHLTMRYIVSRFDTHLLMHHDTNKRSAVAGSLCVGTTTSGVSPASAVWYCSSSRVVCWSEEDLFAAGEFFKDCRNGYIRWSICRSHVVVEQKKIQKDSTMGSSWLAFHQWTYPHIWTSQPAQNQAGAKAHKRLSWFVLFVLHGEGMLREKLQIPRHYFRKLWTVNVRVRWRMWYV